MAEILKGYRITNPYQLEVGDHLAVVDAGELDTSRPPKIVAQISILAIQETSRTIAHTHFEAFLQRTDDELQNIVPIIIPTGTQIINTKRSGYYDYETEDQGRINPAHLVYKLEDSE